MRPPASTVTSYWTAQNSKWVHKALPGLIPDSPSCSTSQLCMPAGSPLPLPRPLSVHRRRLSKRIQHQEHRSAR